MISGYTQWASASTEKVPRTGRYSGSYPVGHLWWPSPQASPGPVGPRTAGHPSTGHAVALGDRRIARTVWTQPDHLPPSFLLGRRSQVAHVHVFHGQTGDDAKPSSR